jgi:hypothetical protein
MLLQAKKGGKPMKQADEHNLIAIRPNIHICWAIVTTFVTTCRERLNREVGKHLKFRVQHFGCFYQPD